MNKPAGRRSLLLASISAISLAAPGLALAAEAEVEELIVTATRREANVQDVPLNISAVGAEAIERQGAADLAEIAAMIPGVHLVDQGGRTSDRIVVRGLNADALGQTDVLGNNAGGIVSTYLGEVPIHIDLKLNDMERVEFLLGPQGTLYGRGTMGGAIRYIPKRPQFDARTLEVRGEGYGYSKADGLSSDYGATANFPINETLAVRASVDVLHDTGFVDYNFVVNRPGVTNPNILTGAGSDLRKFKDANGEKTLAARMGVRWRPVDWLDANLTYYHQDQKSEGRTISSHRGTIPVDKYVSTLRYREPNRRENDLLALELTADLGFAELTSATGYARYKEVGQRDQTNLLITLQYSYEAFPAFSAFTREDQDDENWTQEVRLVSKTDGPMSWIVGGFYSKLDSDGSSREFTPGFDLYAIRAFGTRGVPRPDSLEYLSVGETNLTEKAVFGELSYQINDAWQVTAGARYYDYKLVTFNAVDLPLLSTSISPDGRRPNEIRLDFDQDGQKDDGVLLKFNTSYKVTEDALVYFTYSQGYRTGNGNGIAPCPVPLGNFQNVCALPDEVEYTPDKTTNYELGAKTVWMDGRLQLNASAYYLDWKDPQLLSATVNGGGTIVRNGNGAETMGFDVATVARINEQFTVRASYTYTHAELTADAPSVVRTIPDPAIPNPPRGPLRNTLVGAFDGDRLPGSPKHSANLMATYVQPLNNGLEIEANYAGRYISNIYTAVGLRGGTVALDDYTMHDASLTLRPADSDGMWSVTLFADNIFDTFAESGIAGNPRFNQTQRNDQGGVVFLRSYFSNPLPPRKVGVRFTARFGG
ncbi:TonB-dependent receptor [Phenylobacterium sp.]|jgi:outer membrane receptor protein involved in Fe transport|uniref:TonB-dependent receptor n=1 Tax=Phenylobacterium sp. TaxID=1871053 RepID=UPI0037CCAAAC